jgi:predicted metalloprotease with PDZ domain
MKAALLASAVLPLAVPTSATAPAAPLLTISLTPGPMNEARNRGVVQVAMRVPDMHVAAGQPLFTLSTGQDVRISDGRGALPVRRGGTVPDDSGGAYVASRAVSGDLSIRYTVAVSNDAHNGGTTPIFPRLDGTSFSAIGMTLFAIPQTSARYRVAIHWDLSAMGPGAAGVSSLGDGDAESPAQPVENIRRIVVMAGQLHSEPQRPTGRFEAVWGGDPGFDPRPAMQWSQKLHAWMIDFFDTPGDPAYRVFLRNNGGRNAGGGVAFPNSFFATWGPGVTGESMKQILGHEMVHTFTQNELGKWYVEGDAVYYQERLPWRAGMVSTQAYLRDINLTAARYYTNLKIHTTEDKVEPYFFKDPWINTIDYDRGALYFAKLDAMIRKASSGRKSIDDLVRIMVHESRSGKTVDNETWFALLRGNIGETAVTLTKSMFAGAIIVPDSDAYGPCFSRYRTRLRRYELGFKAAPAALGAPAVISGLIPGSEAAKAGLRNGDSVILPALTSEGPRRDPEATVTARVTRGDKSFTVTWLPRGEAVDSYQWKRVESVPDSACRPTE